MSEDHESLATVATKSLPGGFVQNTAWGPNGAIAIATLKEIYVISPLANSSSQFEESVVGFPLYEPPLLPRLGDDHELRLTKSIPGFSQVCWSPLGYSSSSSSLLAALTTDSAFLIFDSMSGGIPAIWSMEKDLTDVLRSAEGDREIRRATDLDALEYTSLAWSPMIRNVSILVVGTKNGQLVLDVVDRSLKGTITTTQIPEVSCWITSLTFAPTWHDNQIVLIVGTSDGAVNCLVLKLDLDTHAVEITENLPLASLDMIVPTMTSFLPLLVTPIPHSTASYTLAFAKGREVTLVALTWNSNKIQVQKARAWRNSTLYPVTGITWGSGAGLLNLFTQDGRLVSLKIDANLSHQELADETDHNMLCLLKTSLEAGANQSEEDEPAQPKKGKGKATANKAQDDEQVDGVLPQAPVVYGVQSFPYGHIHLVFYSKRAVNSLDYRPPANQIAHLCIKPFYREEPFSISTLQNALRPQNLSSFSAKALVWDVVRKLRSHFRIHGNFPQWYEHVLDEFDAPTNGTFDTSKSIKELFNSPGLVTLRLGNYLVQNIPDSTAEDKLTHSKRRVLLLQLEMLSQMAINHLKCHELDHDLLMASLEWIDLGLVLIPGDSQALNVIENLLKAIQKKSVNGLQVDDAHGQTELRLLQSKRQKQVIESSQIPLRHKCPACASRLQFTTTYSFECERKHVWNRCMATLLPIPSPRVFNCSGCHEKKAAKHVWKSPLLDTLIEAVDACAICSSSLESANALTTLF